MPVRVEKTAGSRLLTQGSGELAEHCWLGLLAHSKMRRPPHFFPDASSSCRFAVTVRYTVRTWHMRSQESFTQALKHHLDAYVIIMLVSPGLLLSSTLSATVFGISASVLLRISGIHCLQQIQMIHPVESYDKQTPYLSAVSIRFLKPPSKTCTPFLFHVHVSERNAPSEPRQTPDFRYLSAYPAHILQRGQDFSYSTYVRGTKA